MRAIVTVPDLIRAGVFLFAGVIVGVVVDRLVRARLRRNATITRWGADQVVAGALHDALLLWSSIAGAYAALNALPVRRAYAVPTERALVALAIFTGTVVVARLVGDLVRLRALRTGATQVSSIFVNVGRLVIFTIGALIALQTFGISVAPLLGALGIGGLAVALALQDTLANLFAGIHLIASRKIRTGDYVRVDRDEGYVVDINWRNTSIRTLPDTMVIVPNARMASAVVTNYFRPGRETSITTEVTVAYETDLARAEQVTLEVAREVLRDAPAGVPTAEPVVRYHTFDDRGVVFTVVLRAREYPERHILRHELVKRLHLRFRREGIEIPGRTVLLEPAPQTDGRGRRPPARLS